MFWLVVYLALGLLYCFLTWWNIPKATQEHPEARGEYQRLRGWVYLYLLAFWPWVILSAMRTAYWKHRK